ncbi:MAG: hypothetical protein RLZZ515_727 [Cyanobacteriota bacterium]
MHPLQDFPFDLRLKNLMLFSNFALDLLLLYC